MANLIPSGTTKVQSADFTVAAGTPVTVSVFPSRGDTRVDILLKNSDGTYTAHGQLTPAEPVRVIRGPGTWAVLRQACANAIGVDNSL